MDKIPHSRPLLGPEEAQAAARVVASGMLAEGPEVQALEEQLCLQERLPHAAAVAHGTGGLHLSLLALGIGPGHKVLIPSYACVSLLNPVAYVGAQPVLVDNLPDLPDMDLDQAARLAAADPTIQAAIVPHMFGRYLDVSSLASQIAVIEDSTHSLGHPTELRGETRVVSFFATKLLAGGEGGVVLTRRPDLARAVRDLRSYDEREEWIPRYNYKMTDIAAAILRVQLSRLHTFLARRRDIASFYQRHLPHALPHQPDQVYYRFLLRLPHSVEPLMHALEAVGVATRRPVFRTLHRYLGLSDDQFPHAQRFWEQALSLPVHPALSDEQAQRVVDEIGRCWPY